MAMSPFRVLNFPGIVCVILMLLQKINYPQVLFSLSTATLIQQTFNDQLLCADTRGQGN